MIIPLGNPMKFAVAFTDVNDTPFDPASGIHIQITPPGGVMTQYDFPTTLVKESTGVYSIVLEANVAGYWQGQGFGTTSTGFVVTTEPILQQVGTT